MISFVILHYQAIDETIECVNKIFKYMNEACKVIIVDNYSPNGTGEILKRKYKDETDIHVMLSDKNLGFAKGNNMGYREAKKDGPDYIVVMNNDVFLQDYNIEKKLDEAYSKYQFDILGPDIYSTQSKNHQNPQRMSNFTLSELENERKKLEIKNKFSFLLKIKYLMKAGKRKKFTVKDFIDEDMVGAVLHGACYIFSKKYYQNHNNCFYENTFMYYESYILHYLAQREKLKLLYYPAIKVIHHEDIATDLTYKNMYEKSKFVNKCLLESCKEYIKIINSEEVRLD